MTPKEKAEELVNKFSTVGLQLRNEGIACALIAVDEILQLFKNESLMPHLMNEMNILYWEKVKKEIINL